MPDLMRSKLYEQSLGEDYLPEALPQSPRECNRILRVFDSVFEKVSDNNNDCGVPVATFVEFVRLHLSSRWISVVQTFIDTGCVQVTDNPGQRLISESSKSLQDDVETVEYELRQCVGVLIPLEVVQENNNVSDQTATARVLTLDRSR